MFEKHVRLQATRANVVMRNNHWLPDGYTQSLGPDSIDCKDYSLDGLSVSYFSLSLSSQRLCEARFDGFCPVSEVDAMQSSACHDTDKGKPVGGGGSRLTNGGV
jgi:hypothetical protein